MKYIYVRLHTNIDPQRLIENVIPGRLDPVDVTDEVEKLRQESQNFRDIRHAFRLLAGEEGK